ncbi:hypothetical protein GCWU000246_00552 [Jonquetella anthropi E3_33 E1]|nr:hypothetical protein GCWU000246_00552 [Jonquetella anthropi E3_33 E1]
MGFVRQFKEFPPLCEIYSIIIIAYWVAQSTEMAEEYCVEKSIGKPRIICVFKDLKMINFC